MLAAITGSSDPVRDHKPRVWFARSPWLLAVMAMHRTGYRRPILLARAVGMSSATGYVSAPPGGAET